MSNSYTSNNTKNNPTRHLFTLAVCAGIVASAVSGFVVSRFDFQPISSNAATPNANSVDVIVGQVDTGSNIELSVCLKTDATNTNLHITDSSSAFSYNPATLTPSPTILAAGSFGGNGTPSASYAPLLWKNVIGTTNRWSMDITYTGGAGTLLNTTPNLVGRVQFAKTGNTTDRPSSFSQKFFSVETTTGPMIANLINYNGVCTAYSSTVTPTYVIGTPNPAYSVTGSIGAPFISIYLTGNTFPDGTLATFTPAGSATAITGKIQGGNFVPDANQTIPAGSLTGVQSGTLRVNGGQTLAVPTNYSAAQMAASGGNGGTIVITTNNNTQPTTTATTTPQTTNNTNPTAANVAATNTQPPSNEKVTINQPTSSDYDRISVRTGGASLVTFSVLALLILSYATHVKIKQTRNLKFNRDLKTK